MSAKDVFHEVVKRALQKDGWQITHDQFSISVGGVNISIDLAAQRLLAAEKEGEKIAVEVKSFLERSSAISEFHTALGQFINYRGALRRREPERVLYSSVPLTTYKTFFQLDFPKAMVEENQVKMIIYDVEHLCNCRMEKLERYRQKVQQMLLEYGKQKPAYGDIEVEKIFDTERDHYQIVHIGWQGQDWVHSCIIHIDIKGGKIWRYLEWYRG